MRHGTWHRRWALIAGMAMVVSGCGAAPDSGAGIAAQDPTQVTEGEQLYQASCASCHGADLRGTDRGPSHLSELYRPGHHADGSFLLAIQVGVRAHHWSFGDMAPIEGLSAEDVAAIVAYVRETQRVEGFEEYPP